MNRCPPRPPEGGDEAGEEPSHGLPPPRTRRRPRAPSPRLRARPGNEAGDAPPGAPPAPPDPAGAPTPGQVAWLAALTAAERARFDALPERSRARYLEWHQAGVNPDPILAGEVARLLRPKIQPTPGPSPDEPFALTGEPARPRRPPER